MLPIDQLIKPLSKDEVKDSIYRLMAATGLPVTSWPEGGVARTIVAIVAAIFAGFTDVIAVAIRAGFLDLAEGIWLTLLARYVYGVDRIEATFAAGEVTLNNTGGGVYSFDPVTSSSATRPRTRPTRTPPPSTLALWRWVRRSPSAPPRLAQRRRQRRGRSRSS